jgi:GNAT superfamily N-acetyltransferase
MLERDSLTIRLKDGRKAHIREVRLTDAVDLLTLTHAVVSDGRGVVCDMDDVPKTLSELRASLYPYVEGHRSGPNGIKLVAELCNAARTIVATGIIYRLGPSMLRHVATLGLEVHPDYQRRGVGRALMVALLEWARHGSGRTNGGVTRMEMGVRADNSRAIQLYRSLGFEIEAVRKRFVKLPTGDYVDEFMMTRFLPLTYQERWGEREEVGPKTKRPKLRLVTK